MSKGQKTLLKHGKKGDAPVVGVKMFEGTLYWAINGEFMHDASGNKIKAEGQDGKDGIDGVDGVAPKLRVDKEGFWEISLDGGKKWESLLDANGDKVKAVGRDATVDLQITEDKAAGTITIVYNGQTFVFNKNNNGGAPVAEGFNPLRYVAEYNMADLNGAFDTTHDNTGKYFYKWQETMDAYQAEKVIGGVTYYLPSKKEWNAFFSDWVTPYAVDFISSGVRTFEDEPCAVAGRDYTYKGNYQTIEGVVYAVVEYVADADPAQVHYVAYRYAHNEAKAINRVLPAAGYKSHVDGALDEVGASGYFWSTTNSVTGTRCAYFTQEDTTVRARNAKRGHSIRLFIKK